MKFSFYLSTAVAAILLGTTIVQAQQVIPLYPADHVPFALAAKEQRIFIPTLTIYTPQGKNISRTAVIVCSGGAYQGRANSGEGIPAATKLAQAGITAFLLDYRLPDSTKMIHKEIVPLTDAQRAIQYVRENAEKFGIDVHRLGVMGFSAGGHLVSTAGTHFNTTRLSNPRKTNLRPDFLVLVYPVISFADSLTHILSRNNLIGPNLKPELIQLYSNELQVTGDTPPTYMTHAIDDKLVKIENSLFFEAALRQHHVPVELFIYARGGHGYGINNTTATVQWIDQCIAWIKDDTWLKEKPKSSPVPAN